MGVAVAEETFKAEGVIAVTVGRGAGSECVSVDVVSEDEEGVALLSPDRFSLGTWN